MREAYVNPSRDVSFFCGLEPSPRGVSWVDSCVWRCFVLGGEMDVVAGYPKDQHRCMGLIIIDISDIS